MQPKTGNFSCTEISVEFNWGQIMPIILIEGAIKPLISCAANTEIQQSVEKTCFF